MLDVKSANVVERRDEVKCTALVTSIGGKECQAGKLGEKKKGAPKAS